MESPSSPIKQALLSGDNSANGLFLEIEDSERLQIQLRLHKDWRSVYNPSVRRCFLLNKKFLRILTRVKTGNRDRPETRRGGQGLCECTHDHHSHSRHLRILSRS